MHKRDVLLQLIRGFEDDGIPTSHFDSIHVAPDAPAERKSARNSDLPAFAGRGARGPCARRIGRARHRATLTSSAATSGRSPRFSDCVKGIDECRGRHVQSPVVLCVRTTGVAKPTGIRGDCCLSGKVLGS